MKNLLLFVSALILTTATTTAWAKKSDKLKITVTNGGAETDCKMSLKEIERATTNPGSEAFVCGNIAATEGQEFTPSALAALLADPNSRVLVEFEGDIAGAQEVLTAWIAYLGDKATGWTAEAVDARSMKISNSATGDSQVLSIELED